MGMSISIIVTTHHRPYLLRRCLSSILSQNFNDYEIVLCSDEGSIETKTIAMELLRPVDKFLVLPTSKGPAETRNHGMLFAEGERIIFLDDDDTFDVGYFEALNQNKRYKDDILYANYSVINEIRMDDITVVTSRQNYHTGKLNAIDMYKGGIYPINSVAFNAYHAKKFKFDPLLKAYEDLDYMLNFVGWAEFQHIDIYGPNVHVSNSSTRNPNETSVDSAVRGYLSIWLKHPSPNHDIRQYRADILKEYGVVIPDSFL